LTGWNAIFHRSKQLQLELTDDQVKAATSLLKNLADERNITLEQVDSVLLELTTVPQTASSKLSSFAKEKRNLSPQLEAAAKAAAEALAIFEREAAKLAVTKIQEESEARIRNQPTCALKLQGHIFDTRCINEIFDVLVDSPCKFEISQLDLAPKNEMTSTAYLRVWAEKEADLEAAKTALHNLVSQSYKESCALYDINTSELPQ